MWLRIAIAGRAIMEKRELLRIVIPDGLLSMPELRRCSPGDAPEMLAESFDFVRVMNESFDFHRRAAHGAEQRVDFED